MNHHRWRRQDKFESTLDVEAGIIKKDVLRTRADINCENLQLRSCQRFKNAACKIILSDALYCQRGKSDFPEIQSWRMQMYKKSYSPIMLAGVILIFASLACSVFQPATPTAVPTDTPIPATATNMLEPTSTPRPTATPNVATTQRYDDVFSQVQKFADDGLISSTNGEYIELDDFKETFSQLGWYQSYPTKLVLEAFVFVGHLKWQTAAQTSDVSGCGLLFAQQEDTSDYAVFLDKSRIYFSSSTPRYYSELGKTRGSGRLNLGNPAEADLTLLVYKNYAYVYVDNKMIGEYTLSKDKPLKGIFGYGIISGTNRDYGTRCEVTNARVWSLKP